MARKLASAKAAERGGKRKRISADLAARSESVLRGFLKRHLVRIVRLAGGLLRELADQNAYERHLRSRGVEHSAEEWRRFADARFGAKYTRPKCC